MLLTQRQTKRILPIPEAMVNDDPRSFTDADFPIGSASHQGDLILVHISALPSSARLRQNRQLALGDTRGSRHVLETGTAYDCDQRVVANAIRQLLPEVSVAAEYIGPIFQTVDGRAHLSHPEHGDHHYCGDMTIAVIYQRNQDTEDRERRVQD